jgi:hypothetical protein
MEEPTPSTGTIYDQPDPLLIALIELATSALDNRRAAGDSRHRIEINHNPEDPRP